MFSIRSITNAARKNASKCSQGIRATARSFSTSRGLFQEVATAESSTPIEQSTTEPSKPTRKPIQPRQPRRRPQTASEQATNTGSQAATPEANQARPTTKQNKPEQEQSLAKLEGFLNKAVLVGNIGSDYTIKPRATGQGRMALFTLVTKQANRAQFHNVKVFNDELIDKTIPFLKKGFKALVTGPISYSVQIDKATKRRLPLASIIPQHMGDIVIISGDMDRQELQSIRQRTQPQPAQQAEK